MECWRKERRGGRDEAAVFDGDGLGGCIGCRLRIDDVVVVDMVKEENNG